MFGYGCLHTHDMGSCTNTGADGGEFPRRKAAYAKKLGQEFLGITNHGNVYTWLEHVKACQAVGIQPVLGIEAYHMRKFAKKPLKDEIKKNGYTNGEVEELEYLAEDYHLTLHAQNNRGIENIYKMLTIASKAYFYGHIIFPDELLEECAEGVICFSGCLGSYISQHILKGDVDAAREQMHFFKKIFKDNFYLEVMPYDNPDQIKVNTQLQLWSDLEKIPLVATDDSHYADPRLLASYEILKKIRNYPPTDKVDYSQLHMHDEDQMIEMLKTSMHWEYDWARKAVEETGRIAAKCSISFDNTIDMPVIPGVVDADAEFKKRCLQGVIAKRKYTVDEDGKKHIFAAYNERLAHELDIIKQKGFAGYLLVSASLSQHAQEKDYEVQGRGSVCNSLAAWFAGIHHVDPIRYKLDFSRFLNENSISFPDVDDDCPDIYRDELIGWMGEEYGHAVPVSTFGTYKTQSLANQLVRVLAMENGDEHRFRDALKDYNSADVQPSYKAMMSGTAEYVKEFRYLESKYRAVTHYCWLWGQMSTVGMHAGGVVLSHDDILKKLAIVRSHDDEKRITYSACYDMTYLESMLGLLKFDVLGLRTLTIILEAEKHAGVKYTDVILTDEERADRENYTPFLYDDVDLASAEVLQLIKDADTLGLMQLETETPVKYCKKLQPDTPEEVAVISALNRPMAKGVFDKYLAWKQGKGPRPVVYQEEIIERCRKAGLNQSQIDSVMKALKKKLPLDADIEVLFVAGLQENEGYTKQEAQEAWDMLDGYGFAQGHATAYMLLALRQAWLKRFHTFSFFLAVLRNAKKDDRKSYEADAARHGIRLLVPSVNGGANYTDVVIPEHLDKNGVLVAEKRFIQQGMCVVDGVGETRAQTIEEERLKNGDYKDRQDLEGVLDARGNTVTPGRVPRMIVNKTVMAALDNCGALCFDGAVYMRRSNQFTNSRAMVPATPLGSDDDKWRGKYRNGKYKR